MSRADIRLETKEAAAIFGLWEKAGDKTASKDIRELSAKYHRLTQSREGSVLPFYVLSRNYDEKDGSYELFIGSDKENPGLERLVLPAGEYAVMSIRPKLGFLWGIAVGEAKRYFYREWLPKSGLAPLNMEYEYHSEKTLGKHPTEDIVFAVCRQ